MKLNKLISLFVFFALFSAALHAKPYPPTDDSSYDGLAPGGRSLAMGQAFTALGGDPSTIFFNPAGLTSVEKQYFSMTFEVTRQSALTSEEIFSSEMLRNKNLIFLGLISNNGAFSWRPLSDAVIRTASGADWKETEIKINQYTLSAGHRGNETVDSGMNISYINGRVAESGTENGAPFANIADGNGLSVDFGLLYHLTSQFNLGLNFKNLAGFIWWDDYEQEQLPFTLRGGFAFNIGSFLVFSSDWEKKFNRGALGPRETVHFGIEQAFGKIIQLRGGVYGEDLRDADKTVYTAGIGYFANKYSLSFSGEKYKINGFDVFRYLFSLDLPI
ncbi:MAG TPA: hypothetical protein DEE98_02250 [Elusimicrobia bacterium]|nr:MAG: hypothetical protein A2278_08370 [Elusimicrobia bacterium RIFOXYA12_FULL_49_49]OGS09450.1 MAG: hypothetical protein A2204_01920 [Elusimicrobia bacterium RIFOXYA1_FULL_47_7]OGS15921.1 MAG: hypothetical protein A2251_01895 [Elusimicrobia bacterium RIFOXYA2_FULL_47_53]OGS26397.1 MAG: hypothetical protein A2339_03375 [Elusimicrobia bacterium RIFOXYB12_FULL_50_12]OGS29089.1 MAG: hypothetical protein A2323_04435 [Elusimicrobia bacterium RIFOXYB2_FULL_46_23]HBU69184.1 hypothetical protein [El